MASFTLADIPDLTGKIAIVTGSTGGKGLGIETALALAGAGAEVIVAGRNAAKGEEALARIHSHHPKASARFEPLDLADLSSVKAFADRLLAEGRPVDILVNNAGVMANPRRETTVDAFEKQFGTNYLGHFALTRRLLPLLKTGHARVVQLASIAHKGGRIALDDLQHQHEYKPWSAYQQSKLAMLMFAIELDRRSDVGGWGLTSVAAHPGYARTDLIANGPLDGGSGGLVMRVAKLFEPLLSHSASEGALSPIMAATAPGLKGGTYWGPQGFQELKGRPGPAEIRPQARDTSVAAKLWSESERLTGVSFG